MSVPASRSDGPVAPQRARAGVRIVVGLGAGGSSAPLTVAERGGYRVRFPRGTEACEGVLINTGGGIVGGDEMTVEADVLGGAEAVLTTQSAEKVYRSDGAVAQLTVRLALRSGARLDWMPQEQILFDGARLRRTIDVAMPGDASLLLVEQTVLGRRAMCERLLSGSFSDRWRVRRDGRLIFAEAVKLEGAIDALLARPALGQGARATATVLAVSATAEARREEARNLLEGSASQWGVSAWDGMILARLLSPDPRLLRIDLARFLRGFRGRPLPRSWQT